MRSFIHNNNRSEMFVPFTPGPSIITEVPVGPGNSGSADQDLGHTYNEISIRQERSQVFLPIRLLRTQLEICIRSPRKGRTGREVGEEIRTNGFYTTWSPFDRHASTFDTHNDGLTPGPSLIPRSLQCVTSRHGSRPHG